MEEYRCKTILPVRPTAQVAYDNVAYSMSFYRVAERHEPSCEACASIVLVGCPGIGSRGRKVFTPAPTVSLIMSGRTSTSWV